MRVNRWIQKITAGNRREFSRLNFWPQQSNKTTLKRDLEQRWFDKQDDKKKYVELNWIKIKDDVPLRKTHYGRPSGHITKQIQNRSWKKRV